MVVVVVELGQSRRRGGGGYQCKINTFTILIFYSLNRSENLTSRLHYKLWGGGGRGGKGSEEGIFFGQENFIFRPANQDPGNTQVMVKKSKHKNFFALP